MLHGSNAFCALQYESLLIPAAKWWRFGYVAGIRSQFAVFIAKLPAAVWGAREWPMASYATKVKRDIARWREAGLIDDATAGSLSLDVERNAGTPVSFGAVLAMMAAALFAAAILVFVAANWEALPRLARVAMLFALIAAGYVGGAVLKLSGREAAGEGAWIVAATAFGASIALIAQIYHMSGDEAQAVLVWGVGTALAAAALRSGPLTVGAVLLAGAWMAMETTSGWRLSGPPLSWLALAAALYALSFFTRSLLARHLVLLSLYLFVALVHFADQSSFAAPLALAAAAAGLLAFGHLRPAEADRLLGLGQGLPVQALAGFLAGVGAIQITLVDEPGFVFPTILAFAGIVAALLVAGRDSRALRWFAYAAFAFHLCFLYVVMLGTMMDTAGFFLLAGLTLSALAWLIARFERRIAGTAGAGDAA